MSYASRSFDLAGLVELDQRAQRLRGRLGRELDRLLEVADDRGDRCAVPAAGAVDLLGQRAALLHQPRVQRVRFLEPLEILHRHADVEVVRARGEDVLPRRRRLLGDFRIDRWIEEMRLQPRQQRVERLAALQRERRARLCGGFGRGGERLRRAREHEFLRRQVVVLAAVDPEQLGVALNLGERRLLDLRLAGGRDDRFDDVAHLEGARVLLIEEDVTSGDRCLVEMPDQRLVLERQLVETVRIQLHDRRIVDAVEEVLAIAGRPGRRALRRRCGRGSFLRRLSSAARRNRERGQPSRYTFRRHRSVTIYLDSVFVRRVAVAQPFRAGRGRSL